MNPTQPNGPGRQSLSEEDERAINALIDEVQQLTPAPPDLAALILGELARQDQQSSRRFRSPAAPAFADSSACMSARTAKKQRRSVLQPIAGLLALAASSMLLYVCWDPTATDEQVVAVNQNTSPDAARGPSQVNPNERSFKGEDADSSQPALRTPQRSVPRQGVPLVRTQPLPERRIDSPLGSPPEVTVARDSLPREDAVVLVRFNTALAQYWDRLGVAPAASLDAAQLKEKIKRRFGTSPEFDSEEEISAFAGRLVERLMRDVPLAAGARETMVQQAAQAIQKREAFDAIISRWVADASLFHSGKPEQLSQALATNLLDVDAACARCHDSPVDGRFAQHDYWSFASVFASKERSPLFYELLDGRQQAATARVPGYWMGRSFDDDGGKDLRNQFSQSLRGNAALAGALANRLWEIGFDAPLVSRASDPLAPPRDDALQTSHKLITNAILASNFDIRAAAGLVMSSEAMNRGPSDLHLASDWPVASEEVIAKDLLAQRAFAAGAPTHARLGRDELVALMESRIGQTPRVLDNRVPVLAQPSAASGGAAGGDTQQPNPKPEEYLWAEWTADRELLRESWLHWIKSPEQKQRHALYAAGVQSAAEADDLMKRLARSSAEEPPNADDVGDRLFWVLRKTK